MEFFLHFFKIGNIHDIIRKIVTDTFFDNLNCYSNGYAIFFYLLLLDCCWDKLKSYFYKVPSIFLYKYGVYKV